MRMAPQAVSVHEKSVMDRIVRTAWLIERDSAIAREVTRAVDVVNDGWMDAMDRLQRQVRRQQGERDAAVAARDGAVAERDAARRRVKELEERIMRDLFRTADEAGTLGLPVLSGTPHVTVGSSLWDRCPGLRRGHWLSWPMPGEGAGCQVYHQA